MYACTVLVRGSYIGEWAGVFRMVRFDLVIANARGDGTALCKGKRDGNFDCLAYSKSGGWVLHLPAVHSSTCAVNWCFRVQL
jgi:hypothetical protein